MQSPTPAAQAAALLARTWSAGQHLEQLPPECRPGTLAQGYAVQGLWSGQLAQPVAGWKIAATSEAGQKHIAVSGPLAGPVFAHKIQADGATVSLAANRMRVAECEVVFHFRASLAPQPGGFTRSEVLAAVGSVGPGLEMPDSRFVQFELAGAAQLTADCACTNDMVLAAALPLDDRVNTLDSLIVRARMGDGRVATGVGRNVMGDPVEALVWLVNELGRAGLTLQAGQFVTTGACVPPIAVQPGEAVEADFGWLGTVRVQFSG